MSRDHSLSRPIRIGVEPRVSEVPRRGPAVTTSEVVVTAGSVRREDGSGAGPLPALGRCSRRGSLLERLTTVVPNRSLRSTSTTAITKIHSASTKPRRRATRVSSLIGRSPADRAGGRQQEDRKSTRLNSSHVAISYAVFCLKKK